MAHEDLQGAPIESSRKMTKSHFSNRILKDNLKENSSVSYLGAVYTSRNYANSRPLDKLLSQYEKADLISLVKRSLEHYTKKENSNINIGTFDSKMKPVFSPNYHYKKGVFVTLKKEKQLRGCIGTTKQENTIINNVIKYTWESGFNDSRVGPITKEEMEKKLLTYDINILDAEQVLVEQHATVSNKETKIKDEWRMGQDGIIIKHEDGHGAIYLPSVPTEQGWTKKQTLEHLSKKAGLEINGWEEKEVEIRIIPGYEFGTES